MAHDAVVLKAGGGIGNGGADGKRFAIARFGARHVPQVAIVGIALYVAQAIVAASIVPIGGRGAQQLLIEFAYFLNRRLQFLVIRKVR